MCIVIVMKSFYRELIKVSFIIIKLSLIYFFVFIKVESDKQKLMQF